MKIRHERFSDKETISSIHYAAFKNHPQYAQGAEPTEHLVVEHLRAANAMTLSLVAEKNSELLGHIAFSVAPIGYLTGGWHLLGLLASCLSIKGKALVPNSFANQ